MFCLSNKMAVIFIYFLQFALNFVDIDSKLIYFVLQILYIKLTFSKLTIKFFLFLLKIFKRFSAFPPFRF